MIKSQMPTLNEFEFKTTERLVDDLRNMEKFCESKPILNRNHISFTKTKVTTIPFTFLRLLIEISKEPTSKRPFLNVLIYPLQLREEGVSI